MSGRFSCWPSHSRRSVRPPAPDAANIWYWHSGSKLMAYDLNSIAVEGGVVKYYRNGVLQYTSAQSPSYPLLVDVSLESTSASVQGAVISGAP